MKQFLLLSGFFLFVFLFPAYKLFSATYYSKATGNWGNAATWGTACGTGTGAVPGTTDDVVICSGHSITMNVNGAQCNSITLAGGTMTWSNARTTTTVTFTLQGGTITGSQTGTLNVSGNLTATTATTNIGRCDIIVSGTSTINTGVIVNITSPIGTKNFGNLIISGTFNNAANSPITITGNLQNDGSYTVGTGQVTFSGASNSTITGTQTTAFASLNIDKGTSNANVLDVQSLISLTAGGLSLTNGTLKLSNSSITITPFTVDITAAPYLIPSTAGFWCNGATINSGNFNWTTAGLIRVSAGTLNLGNSTNNILRAQNSGTTELIVEGGTLNVAGAISRQGAADFITFTMSGGTILVPAVGLNTAGISPVQIDQASTTFTMSGGTIDIRQAGATNLGFTATAGTVNVIGGIIQIGDASTPAAQTINVNSAFSIANLTVNSANATARLMQNLTVLQSINISSGTLNANNFNATLGSSWTNNGTWTPGTGTVTFNGTGTQTITKAGGETFNSITVNKSGGTVSLANNLQVNSTLTMTSGSIDCSSSTVILGISAVSPGTLTYTAGTIIGTFKRWKNSVAGAISFPIGTSSDSRSALITFTNIVGGTLTASFVSSNPGNNGLPLVESGKTIANQYTEGYWNFAAADGLSSTNYAVELTGNGFTSYSVAPSTRLIYRTSSGNPWTLNGTHSAASGNTAKRLGVNGISTAQFGFGKTTCSAYSATSITGNTSVCTNAAGVAYSVTNTVGNTYTWLITGGAQASGGTTNSITVNWGAVGMVGSVQVTEQNDCGDNNTPVVQSVTIHPITTSAITGSTSVATGETGVAYSVTNTAGYTYTWTLPAPPAGGTVASGQGTNAVTINWGATAGTYTVTVTTTRLCAGTDSRTLAVTVKAPIKSASVGPNPWLTGTTWVGGVVPTATDYVEIQAGHTVRMNDNTGTGCYKLTINGTANWTTTRTTNVGAGGIVINSAGNITGVTNGVLTSTGGFTGTSNSDISSATVNIILQTTAGQNITSSGAFNKLQIDATTTNTGTVKIANSGTLSGSSALTQASASTLTFTGSTFTLTTLNASAANNTVSYNANSNQTVRSATYDDLVLSGAGTKTLGGAITVNDDISVTGVTLDASASNYSITVKGDWTNSGTFNPRYATVTLSGSAAQTITRTGGETFHSLIFSGGGTKNLANDVTINFDFTNSSTFNAGTNNINIKGNWDNSGSFSATNNITFSNNTTITGPSTTTFNNVTITGTLTGHLTNFNVSGNWTNNGTFTHNGGKVTFSGNTTISGSATTTFGNADITGTLTSSSGNLNIARNFNNTGTFNHNIGTLTFNGSLAQTVQGNNIFNNLTINNSSIGGVAVTGGTDSLLNTLTLTNGIFTTNDVLVLVSNTSGTARIAPITGGSISGDMTMQRFIQNAPNSWRQLGTAVSGQTLQDWKDDFFMTGFPGSHQPGNSFKSVMSYNESVAGVKENGWTYPSDISDPIGVGQGFMCYVGNGGSNIRIDVKGNTNTGTIPLPVTYNDYGLPSDDGWNLLANPYPSNIDWDLIYPTTSNISATIAVWNPATSNYGQYTFGGPNPGPNGGVPIINSTQAFWVQATGASPDITLTEPAKSATTQAFFKLAGGPDVLKLIIESSNNYADETFLIFKDSASANFNSDEDALKLFSSYDVPHIVSVIDDSFRLAINNMPVLINDIVIPLHAGGKATQSIGGGNYICNKTFTISAAQIDAISKSICVVLEDTKTGILINLRDTSYSFTVSDTSNAPSPRFVPQLTSAPRFLIHIGSAIEKSSINVTCSGTNDGIAIAKGKGIGPFDYTWKDENNSVVKFTSGINAADTLKNISDGTYTVEISGNSGFCSFLTDTIIVNANPAAINLISDITGTTCFGSSDGTINLFVSGDNPPFTYQWNNGEIQSAFDSLQTGNYSVTITDGINCSSTQNFSVPQPEPISASFNISDTVFLSDGGNGVFENTSVSGDYYVWDFGDGSSPDSSMNPVHQYTNTGTFTVTLSVSSDFCGNDIATAQITILQTPNVGINKLEVGSWKLEVSPNPSDGKFKIFNLPSSNCEIKIYNILGEIVFSKQRATNNPDKVGAGEQIATNLPNGIYFLKISDGKKISYHKIEIF